MTKDDIDSTHAAECLRMARGVRNQDDSSRRFREYAAEFRVLVRTAGNAQQSAHFLKLALCGFMLPFDGSSGSNSPRQFPSPTG